MPGTSASATYAPDFRVRVNGADLPAAVRATITSVRYEDGTDAADRVEVEMANPDLRWLSAHIRGLGVTPYPTGVALGPLRPFTASPTGLFDVDNRLGLSLGYAGAPLTDVFDGNVTGIAAAFPNGGMPTLTLVAHDRLNRLAQGGTVRGFGLLPDFLVAAVLAAENLLVPAIDPVVVAASSVAAAVRETFQGASRAQAGRSDLELLAEIAASYDAHFWAEGDVLHLSRIPRETTPSVRLTWGQSLLDVAPRMTTVGQIAGVAARFSLQWLPLELVVTAGWDLDREVLSVTVRPADTPLDSAGGAGAGGGGGPVLTIADRRIGGYADIATSAVALVSALRARFNSRLTASGAAVGDPAIRSGSLLRIGGLGPDFSGDYRVDEATHVVDAGGYRTTFSVRREIIP
jgi:phage protein D